TTNARNRYPPSEIFYMYCNSLGLFMNNDSIPVNYSKKWSEFQDRLSQFIDEKECPLLCKYAMDNSYDWSPEGGFTYSSIEWKYIADAFIAGFIVAKQLPSIDPKLLSNGEAV
ncbi:hypothetical protein PFISCL1PPCAC_27473, partial [Pristionchus fissidentatus]